MHSLHSPIAFHPRPAIAYRRPSAGMTHRGEHFLLDLAAASPGLLLAIHGASHRTQHSPSTMSTTTPLFPTAPTSSDLFVNPRTATTNNAPSTTTNTNGGYGWGGGGYGTGQGAYFQTVVISLVALAVLLIISVASPASSSLPQGLTIPV